ESRYRTGNAARAAHSSTICRVAGSPASSDTMSAAGASSCARTEAIVSGKNSLRRCVGITTVTSHARTGPLPLPGESVGDTGPGRPAEQLARAARVPAGARDVAVGPREAPHLDGSPREAPNLLEHLVDGHVRTAGDVQDGA